MKIFCSAMILTLFMIWLPASSQEIDQATKEHIQRVEKAIGEAKIAGALWRDTSLMFEQAKQLISSGDIAQARTLLDQSLYQAETALNQAAEQQGKNIIPFYLRN